MPFADELIGARAGDSGERRHLGPSRVRAAARSLTLPQRRSGARAEGDATPFCVNDPTGPLMKITEERGHVVFPDAEAARASEQDFFALVHNGINA